MNFRIPQDAWQNLIPLINALSGQDDYGEKEL
jgi:hypothetical protein